MPTDDADPDHFELVSPAPGEPSELRNRLVRFVQKWQFSQLTERAGAQSHFHDLCDLLGVPTPSDVDTRGDNYVFEKNVLKTGGGSGFADVWLRGHFAWEYKGPKKNLSDAYNQLLRYREDLENPPLLVVCDLNQFQVHTNYTGTVKARYDFDLQDLVRNQPTERCRRRPLDVLHALWKNPESLRPDQTTADITRAAAVEFSRIAEALRQRGVDPQEAARFLIRLLFCMFAEDVGLLPDRCFSRLIEATRQRPEVFRDRVGDLFRCMADGGWFGDREIKHFNGGLFADSGALYLSGADLAVLETTAGLGWENIEPSILGTLFERGLDPAKRTQLGAHYTSEEDILAVVRPVLVAPLRREWESVRDAVQRLVSERYELMRTDGGRAKTPKEIRAAKALDARAQKLLAGFRERLRAVRVLDPACGSGNFLYVALRELLDLEKAVISFSMAAGLGGHFHQVGPEQMRGIELNEYAHELASVTVWIGYIQWLRDNGAGLPGEPILRSMELIRQQDAILNLGEDGAPREPDWPEAEVIIGNPPFLGGNRIRQEMGDAYVENLFRLYDGRVPAFADLVCYWFERARSLIAAGKLKRCGFIATNSIRGGANRRVLERIKETGDIFLSWGDRPWVLDGASVRVSLVGFDDGSESEKTADGSATQRINADLSTSLDLANTARLPENLRIAFMGFSKKGPFDISRTQAETMLSQPVNPNGRENSDVVRPWFNGIDITRRPRDMWIIDFGADMPEETAALYEAPFEYVRQTVKPLRDENNRAAYRLRWWLHAEPRPALRTALTGLQRCIVTPTVSRHRVFVWMPTEVVPDQQLIVFARDDDYFFGVLHSRVHELWSLRMCTWMGVGNDPRYTPSTTFETFPFPFPPGKEPGEDDPRYPLVAAIADAARDLNDKRDAWLNPPGGADPAELKKRTLTNLYNARPTWLANAHARLDRAVFAAYGWTEENPGEEELLSRLLALNKQRA